MRTLGIFGLKLAVLALVGGVAGAALGGCDNGERAPAREPSNPPQRAFTDPGAAGPQSQPATAPTSPRAAVIGPNRDENTATVVPPPMMDIDRSFAGKNEAAADDQSGQSQAKTEQPLTDSQVLGFAVVANEGEANMAELAIKKASMPEVKQFAGMMKSHHNASAQKAKTIATKTKLEPQESTESQQLKSDASTVIKDLRDKDAHAFDKAYMDAQVKAHKDVLTAMDSRLIPSVTNGEIKAYLVDMRKTVADHLVRAESLVKKVDQSPSTAVSTTKNTNPTDKHQPSTDKQQDQSSKAKTPGTPPISPDRH